MNRLYAELRSTVDGDRLIGHAAVFGQHAQIRGGYEAIDRHAFDRVLDTDNVRALVDHDPSKLLGSTGAGTLKLSTDDVGLAFEIELPHTSYAVDLRELVRRGDLTGASFGFHPGTDKITRTPDGKQLRTHTSVKQLLDVSVVSFPAYSGTDIALRHVTFTASLDRRTQLLLARHRARLTHREVHVEH